MKDYLRSSEYLDFESKEIQELVALNIKDLISLKNKEIQELTAICDELIQKAAVHT